LCFLNSQQLTSLPHHSKHLVLINNLHGLILFSLMLSAGLKRVQPFVAAGNRGNVQHYYSRHTSGSGRRVHCSAATMQQVSSIITLLSKSPGC
jgi:hypothetical protein